MHFRDEVPGFGPLLHKQTQRSEVRRERAELPEQCTLVRARKNTVFRKLRHEVTLDACGSMHALEDIRSLASGEDHLDVAHPAIRLQCIAYSTSPSLSAGASA